MGTLEEIKQAIEKLPREEFFELARRLSTRELTTPARIAVKRSARRSRKVENKLFMTDFRYPST